MPALLSPGYWSTTHRVALVSFFAQLYFYIPALTPYLQGRGLSLAQISALQALLIGAALVLEVPTGLLADRVGRRWCFTLALGAQALGELVFLFARDFRGFVVAQVLAGTGYALISGSVDALVYDALPAGGGGQAMQRAKGLIGSATQAGNFVAYIGGAILVAGLAPERIALAIVLTVLALTIALMLSLLIDERRASAASAHTGSLTLLLDGLGLLRRNKPLQRIVLATLLTNAFGMYLLVLYQAYFLRAAVRGVWFGLALAIGAVLALVGQRYAYLLTARFGVRGGMLLATATPGVLYLLMAAIAHPVLAVVLFCAQWGAIQVSAPLFSAYLNGHIGSSQRATVLSLINALTTVYVVLMGLGIGRLADTALPAAFALMGGTVLVGAVVLRLDERVVNAEAGR